jgi:hypothetical protein
MRFLKCVATRNTSSIKITTIQTKICHDLKVCDYRRALDRWIGFTDHLYTPLGTTSNYSAIVDLHSLQITTH